MDINKNVGSCRYIIYFLFKKEVIESLWFNAWNNQFTMKRNKCNIGLGV